jgi:hypothetical protein
MNGGEQPRDEFEIIFVEVRDQPYAPQMGGEEENALFIDPDKGTAPEPSVKFPLVSRMPSWRSVSLDAKPAPPAEPAFHEERDPLWAKSREEFFRKRNEGPFSANPAPPAGSAFHEERDPLWAMSREEYFCKRDEGPFRDPGDRPYQEHMYILRGLPKATEQPSVPQKPSFPQIRILRRGDELKSEQSADARGSPKKFRGSQDIRKQTLYSRKQDVNLELTLTKVTNWASCKDKGIDLRRDDNLIAYVTGSSKGKSVDTHICHSEFNERLERPSGRI